MSPKKLLPVCILLGKCAGGVLDQILRQQPLGVVLGIVFFVCRSSRNFHRKSHSELDIKIKLQKPDSGEFSKILQNSQKSNGDTGGV